MPSLDKLLHNPPIAHGRTAAIYAWYPGTVLKLYRSDYPIGHIELEVQRAQIAHRLGIQTPAVLELTKLGDCYGLVFERIDGPTLVEAMLATPDAIESLACEFARLHCSMHHHTSDGDMLQTRRLTRQITDAPGLDSNLKETLIKLLLTHPTQRQLCHGDFHPGNVLVSQHGLVVIDWLDLNVGNPWADVTRTTLLLTKTQLSDALNSSHRQLLERLRISFCMVYLERYAQLQAQSSKRILDWQQIIAAARLSEGITNEQELETLLALAYGQSTLLDYNV